MNLLDTLEGWFDKHLDMHLSFDGDPVLRPEHKPATLTPIAQHVERLKGRKAK